MSCKVLIVVLVMFFLGCKHEELKPSNVLPKQEMIQLIVEIELSQAAFKIKSQDKKFDLDKVSNSIFEKHKTTSQNFDESLKYYTSRPSQMEEIYNEVISILSQKQVGVSN